MKPDSIPDYDIPTIIHTFATYTIILGILITLFYMIWAGIQWIMSSGDKQKIEAAKNRLTYAIAGLVLLFLSFFIVNLIQHLFGIQ